MKDWDSKRKEWHRSLARRADRRKRETGSRKSREGGTGSALTQESAARALEVLLRLKKILWFREFEYNSTKDSNGWDFLVLLRGMKFVGIDVTLNRPKTLERKFRQNRKRGRWPRLIIPLETTDAALTPKRLAKKLFPPIRNHEPKLSLEELKKLGLSFDIEAVVKNLPCKV